MQSDLLDIVIGVVFTWFLLSLVLSGVQEGIALLTRARAKNLWLGIGRLFDPAASPLPRALADVAWRLPFTSRLDVRPRAAAGTAPHASSLRTWWRGLECRIADRRDENLEPDRKGVRGQSERLYAALAPQLDEVAKPGRRSKVTQVSAEAFSAALVELAGNVRPPDLRAAAARRGWTQSKRDRLEAALAGQDDAVTLTVDRMAGLAGDDAAWEDQLRQLYRWTAQSLTGRDVATLLSRNPQLAAAVRRAAGTVPTGKRAEAVRKVVEEWFDGEMSRLSTFYRRQNRKVLLLLGIPLVLFAHANSIQIFDNLRRDASLRQAVVVAASGAVTEGLDRACVPTTSSSSTSTTAVAPTTTTTAPGAARTTPTTGVATTTTTTTTLATVSGDAVVAAAAERFTCARNIVDRATEFRVGLAVEDLKGAGEPGDELRPNDVLPYLGHALFDDWGFLGRAVTLVALLFGAQFWFDTLRRLVGMRKTLKGETDGGEAG